MIPVRLTLDEVHARYDAGSPVAEHEAVAAFDWIWLRSQMGSGCPETLPALPGVSESGRAVFAVLGAIAGQQRAIPDAVAAVASRLGWQTDRPDSHGEPWRWLARQWLVPPLMELVEHGFVRPLGDGGLALVRGAQ